MSKLLITFAALAVLSAPAAAGRLDVDLNAANGAAQTRQGDVDVVVTQGFSNEKSRSDSADNDPFNHGDLFGANSR